MKPIKYLSSLILIALLAVSCSVQEDTTPGWQLTSSSEWKFQAGAGEGDAWSAVDFDDSNWTGITAEQSLSEQNLSFENSSARYRKTFDVPDDFYTAMAKKGGVILRLDSVSGMDTVYINGVQSGAFSMSAGAARRGRFMNREYFVPASSIKKGDNLIAVKFYAPWPDDSPFVRGKGLMKGAKLSFDMARTSDKLSLDYAVNDSDFIFFAPSPIVISAKLDNNNPWAVEGDFIVTVTTDDYKFVKADTARIKAKGKQSFSRSFEFANPSPGFYRYTVQFLRGDDINMEKKFNVGFEPEKIQSPIDAFDDFKAFWENSLRELAKVKPNYRMTLVPEQSNDDYEMYFVEMQSLGDKCIRGYYSKPKREGSFPIIVEYMGYGSTPYFSNVKWDGFAHFVPSIRGQGLNRLTKEDDFWITIGLKSKEDYYYRGGFCDVVRAIDFVCSRPEVDATKIAVRGGSQGGALSFVAASLDKRVKACAPNVPFLSDYRDYFRIVDWPRSDLDNYAKTHPDFDWKPTYDLLSYFDIKNLAQWIECPLWMAIGVQDETCPPHINFAAYNQVKSEKYWTASARSGHNISEPEIWVAERKFIREKLGLTQE